MEILQDRNISQSFISKVWQRFFNPVSVNRPPTTNKITTPEDYFMSSAERNHETTSRVLVLDLHVDIGSLIGRYTAARRLNKISQNASKPLVCVPLTSAATETHLNWSRHEAKKTKPKYCSLTNSYIK
ncbi:hypothetical protein TNCT_250681 [Trichonephila clavata]|uniref:Uncharacterized protein n=1 Tax=Trichonephila clavata TaxID=2740835 RepID=A0A8X6LQL7_TRICU|nr:hypothetical protein TNCT_250681 [Trichonephila clavata]